MILAGVSLIFTAIIGVLTYLIGKNNYKNENYKRAVRVVKRNKKISKKVAKTPSSKLNDAYDKLLSDSDK